MRDLLTSISSIFIIVFSFTLLFQPDEPEAEDSKPVVSGATHLKEPPPNKTTLYQKVQGVKVRDGVLIFVTLEKEGLKDYYYPLRSKKVLLCESAESQLPFRSIQFEEIGPNNVRITLSAGHEIDLEQALANF